MYRTNKRGFTLVEILIVVIILGILAAIVIPQFSNASTEARKNSTSSLLQTIRSQIELYKLQHGDGVPNIIGNAVDGSHWNLLTQTSQHNGAGTFGPYLQTVPKNPLNTLNTVVAGNGTASPTGRVGFVYDITTGKIWAGGEAAGMYYNEATLMDSATLP
jgi:general secretion pathway protein G